MHKGLSVSMYTLSIIQDKHEFDYITDSPNYCYHFYAVLYNLYIK